MTSKLRIHYFACAMTFGGVSVGFLVSAMLVHAMPEHDGRDLLTVLALIWFALSGIAARVAQG